LILAAGLFVSGCATSREEAHVKRLLNHPSWPRIEQAAQAEVNRREPVSVGLNRPFHYLPVGRHGNVGHA